MAFTYGEDLTDNSDFVRFHSGDTVESESVLSDAIITSLLATSTSKYTAVIAALQYMKRRLMRPDVRADWVSLTNHAAAVKALDDLIKDKQNEFGLQSYVTTVSHVYRPSSGHTEAPTYTNDDDTE